MNPDPQASSAPLTRRDESQLLLDRWKSGETGMDFEDALAHGLRKVSAENAALRVELEDEAEQSVYFRKCQIEALATARKYQDEAEALKAEVAGLQDQVQVRGEMRDEAIEAMNLAEQDNARLRSALEQAQANLPCRIGQALCFQPCAHCLAIYSALAPEKP